ncbi:MAG: amidohydrolase family protein, partial [Planctomycetes bacterium]|nr:amidohydrolase family protein [Planctomycetota bacterium]
MKKPVTTWDEWHQRHRRFPGVEYCVELLKRRNTQGELVDTICGVLEENAIEHVDKLLAAVDQDENLPVRIMLLGVIENAALLLDGDQIVGVGRQADLQPGEGVEVIDAGDKTIMPGLVDAHVHLVNTGGPLSAMDLRRASDDDMMILSMKNALLAIKSGITTIRDLGGKAFITVAIRDAIAKGVIPGPRVVSCAAALTTTGGQAHYKSLEVDTPDEMKKAVRYTIKGGADCIKIFGSGGNATPGSNPLAAQYSVDEFRVATEEAHRMGKHVAAHVHPT